MIFNGLFHIMTSNCLLALMGASCRGASFDGASFDGASFDGPSCPGTTETTNCGEYYFSNNFRCQKNIYIFNCT